VEARNYCTPAEFRENEERNRLQAENNLKYERGSYETDKILWHYRDLRRRALISFGPKPTQQAEYAGQQSGAGAQ
jgi:hypothetical protein